MKRFVLSTLALLLFVALGITACSGNTVDSAEAFSAAMDSTGDAPAQAAGLLPAAQTGR